MQCICRNWVIFLIYLACSRCRIPIDLPVCPTAEPLQVLHFILYMPLECILFCGVLLERWLYEVLVARNAMFRLVYLNKLWPCVQGGCSMWRWHIFSFVVFVWMWLLIVVFLVLIFSLDCESVVMWSRCSWQWWG